jgi:hypothetical protein
MRKPTPIAVVEYSGEKYRDLTAAQQTIVDLLSSDLIAVLRQLLASGALVVENGRLIVNPKREEKSVE